ncbi:ABC transporter substrate-binding protein [Serinibacter arcticus]|uniref:Oligopeptide ABC transporter, periplasmic oligopeptide-binding protein OppA n=1 Tax=Serinibacter arcticus TaxID=1655435 RepID=A0A4Z1E363_9MICO|nr:ABC transporter substrate-binding protein [Serinibacter arcticus]TGO06376.1 Oligopeptide ABC transporter, periplasmic oligopeptide-binding protein OppA [Serinibacter arcticus]
MARRHAPVLALGLALALTLTACGSGSDTAASGGEQELPSITLGAVTEPTAVPDPLVDGSLAGYSYYYNVFDSLTRLDASGELQPLLATEWTSSEDLTEWTFTLRDDVTFSNGAPLTAQDVAFSYTTILENPASDPYTYMRPLESVEVVDETTVLFRLNTPFSPFPSITTSVSIVPEDVYTELGSEGFADAPIGSGPYTFASRTPGVEYVIERNPDYWGESAPFEQVTFQTIADADARLNGVLSSSLDVALIAPNQVDSLTGAATLANTESNGVTFLGANSTSGPLADVRVREAIELAIDKDALVTGVLSGRAAVATQMIAPPVAGFDPSIEASETDVDRAEELLAEAGYAGEPITLSYAIGGRIPLSEEIVQAVQGMLADVGVTVTLEGMDQSTFSSRVYDKKDIGGLYLNTYAPSQMDGDPVVEDFFAGGYNDYAMSPESAALVQATREVAGEERIAAYGDLMTFNIDNRQMIPLYVPETNYATTDGLAWAPRADGLFLFGALEK